LSITIARTRFVVACSLASLTSFGCAALPAEIPNLPQGETAPSREPNTKYKQRVGLVAGQRFLDKGDWKPVEDQTSFALEFGGSRAGWPVGYEVGVSFSEADDRVQGIDVKGQVFEVYAGARREFDTGFPITPYLAGGVTLLNADAEVSAGGASASDDDTSPGFYVHGGLLWEISTSFYVGLDIRAVLGTNLDIAGVDTDADYEQIAGVIGIAF